MRRPVGQRTAVWLTAGALLLAAQGCSTETQPPATSSLSTTTITLDTQGSTPPSTTMPEGEPSTPSTSSAPVTVPAEASALPLPSDDTRVDALNPEEQADRAEIEGVWRDVWNLYTTIYDVPAAQRAGRIDALMVDPIRTQLAESAAQADSQNLTSYGSITLHPYWYRAVDGLPYAVIGDCRDASLVGAMDRATGEKKSVGTKDNNTVGRFVEVDGHWKLFDVVYVKDVPCTAS